MLKIKKGLKKKIKGKKDKGKEDDLFDPEQLEKYRRELEEKRKAEAEDPTAPGTSSPKDEEWLKFQALTAGVDTILKKTTTDLDKIKESSFYQRKAPIIPENWHEAHSSATANKLANSGPDKGDPNWTTDFQGEDGEQTEAFEEANEEKPPEEFVVPESPEEPEVLDDSLFDTSYLDAIASGEIQLAYIPDSPTEEEGDDPFDTSGVADVVKRIEEAEKQAKRQVNLGNVVDFYSGKGAAALTSQPRPRPGDSSKKARPRPRAVNLLGDDESAPPVAPPDAAQVTSRPKDLFDEILSSPIKDVASPLLDKVPITLVSAPVPIAPKDSPKEDNFEDILGEFDSISKSEPNPSANLPSSTFSLLASVLEPEPEEDEFDEEFAALATESIKKNPSPLPPSEEPQEEEEEEDPFDTTFVEKVAPPGKFELQGIESELLGNKQADDDDLDFDPRVGEPPVVTRNILEDHSPTGEHPPALQPQFSTSQSIDKSNLKSLDPPEDVDPFDTSTVEAVLPGRAELKLLEEELLKAEDKPLRPKLPNFPIKLSAPAAPVLTEDDDFDFDPRAGEPKEEVKSDHLFDTSPVEEAELAHKVLTPHLEPEEVELDPFDTSIASGLVLIPGQLELKLLESELVDSEPQQPIQRELSDPEFDPRGGEEPDPFIVSVNTTLKTEDIFDQTEEITSHKVLTPQLETAKSIVPETTERDYDDPFDTSSIEVLKLLPASELKQIEGELLNAASEFPTARPVLLKDLRSAQPVPEKAPEPVRPPSPKHLLEDDLPEDEIAHKPLTPAEVPSVFNDPFDTSIAEGVVPGKVEIKILEQELLADGGLGFQLSDQDFNPRGPQPIHPSTLSFVSKTLEPTRSTDKANLDDIDPFDTSFAEGNSPKPPPTGPGKAELQALEAELL